MQNIQLSYLVNPFERLFIEKSVESLFYNSIDSYRLKLHNPKTLIEELVTIIHSSISGVLTNNDYVENASKELKKFLDSGYDGLTFKSISKKHYVETLNKAKRENYNLLLQSSKIILKNNYDYKKNLIAEIDRIQLSFREIIDRHNNIIPGKESEFEIRKKHLIILVDYLYVELINRGFSKQYLYRIIQSVFIHSQKPTNYDIQFNIFQKIINKDDEKYTVIFAINNQSFMFNELKKIDSEYIVVDKKFRNKLNAVVSNEAKTFLEKNKEGVFIAMELMTKDYFKAVQLGINKFSKDLDIYHLGYSKKHYKIDPQCLTIGENDLSKSSVVPSNFQIDGYFKSSATIFDSLLDKIKVLRKENVDEESYQKILSAIRYYRTGSESSELETKLLNYWIGLEFIFTSFKTEEKTIDRIRKYLPKCHSLIYVKRNLYDYHRTLKRLSVDGYILNYNDDLNYLLSHSNYSKILDNTDSELLKFRTKFFQKWYEEPNKISDVLNNHQNNLVWNITRLYRIRNEIVHNAAIKRGIYTHISHLKYYLSFMLNSILDFMAENAIDVDNDGRVSIEDFFIAQDIILSCLKGEKLERFIEIKNPNEIFQ